MSETETYQSLLIIIYAMTGKLWISGKSTVETAENRGITVDNHVENVDFRPETHNEYTGREVCICNFIFAQEESFTKVCPFCLFGNTSSVILNPNTIGK